ncbi:hypothetical protein BU23DRAFT_141482 [Bimuria novae-zelandiae CBS 107.79]|uniref:C2H2-type domain-containing protein n=1 Tax=Bimuria novae-zelandiae CBS 107.79 TaxID=1447943 RepID=A0A6A5VDB2_9PLEO|nr:hypothetical protein BU23DRAFT_141482 [Bimuria novae-zelandiae CBS 107.79]
MGSAEADIRHPPFDSSTLLLTMAAKRKNTGAEHAPLQKKPRTESGSSDSGDASDVEANSGSDASADRRVQYTEKGEKRATSEARRSWIYVCDVEGCGQRFNRPCRLESHVRTHTKERPFACDVQGCDRTFPRKDHLQRHITHFHAVPARNHVCDWDGCGKTFTSNGRLQRHKEVHESKFYCTDYPPCKEAFRKQKTLDAHVKTVHLETKAYPCTVVDASGVQCTHGYQTENSLRRHISSAHGEKEEHRYFCMLCPAPGTECEMVQTANGETVPVPKDPLSFATAAELHAHDAEVHPPTCSACGQVFKNQSNLKTHYTSIHASPGNQQLFQCPYRDCGKMFNRRGNLNAHVTQVHENQYRFVCTADAMQLSKHPDLSGWHGENACGKQVKTKAALEQHIRTHHLGLPNRKETRKAAKARKRLIPDRTTVSMLTGVGYEDGRPVACLVHDCPHRFARDRDLKRHVVAKHGYTDADVEAGLLERDAANGGQFWIGGLDDFDPMSMTGSADPSLPQTPMPYFSEELMDKDMQGDFGKLHEGPLDPALSGVNAFNFDTMDVDMGMADSTPGENMQDDDQTGLLAGIRNFIGQMQS